MIVETHGDADRAVVDRAMVERAMGERAMGERGAMVERAAAVGERNGLRGSRKPHPLMRTGEVAELFRVDPSTVIRWAQQGKFQSGRTVGGQRRYLRSEIEAIAAADGMQMTWP